MCACVREREKARGRERERESKKHAGSAAKCREGSHILPQRTN